MKKLSDYEGGEFSYNIFIRFVKEILGPVMEQEFVEEPYYKELWKFHFNKDSKYKGSVVEIARGHSKTEFGIWAAIYRAVYQCINFRSNKKIIQQLIVSADSTTTEEIRRRLLGFLYNCEEFESFLQVGVKNDKSTKKWNSKILELSNKSQIHFRGIKCKRGLHIDFIWIDDPTTESSTLKDTETIDFFLSAILPMATAKNGNVVITGTPLRITDILNVIGCKNEFYHIKMPAFNEDGVLLGKYRFTKEVLNEIKKIMGSVKFECEYLLNPINDNSSLIKRNWIESCFDKNWNYDYNEFDFVYMGVDFASSDAVTADKSILLDIGIKDNKIHILNGRSEKGKSALEVMGIAGLKHSTNKYRYICIEENFVKSVVKEIKDLNLPLKIFWMGNRDMKKKKNYRQDETITISKINAIMRLGTAFENQEIVIPYTNEKQILLAETIKTECISWILREGKLEEIGVHPDWPIGIIMVQEALSEFSPSVSFI